MLGLVFNHAYLCFMAGYYPLLTPFFRLKRGVKYEKQPSNTTNLFLKVNKIRVEFLDRRRYV